MDIAYRCYGKRHGEEALLAWKRKKKRIAATVKLIESGKDPAYNAKHLQFISKLEQKEDLLPYPDCYVPDCGAESLPHSGYCYKRILYYICDVTYMYHVYMLNVLMEIHVSGLCPQWLAVVGTDPTQPPLQTH